MGLHNVSLVSKIFNWPGTHCDHSGENFLLIDVDGNLAIGTNLDLNGKSGKREFSGSGGPGGWRSGKGLKI